MTNYRLPFDDPPSPGASAGQKPVPETVESRIEKTIER